MPFLMRYAITPRYLTAPSKRRSGLPLSPGVKFIVAHDTGNPNSTAHNNVTYYERSRNEMSASAHIFVDDREIIECIPALTGQPEKAWHVRYDVPGDDRLFGYDANDAAIGVEYCFGAKIDADEAYRKYVWVMAYICFKFDLAPERSIVGHAFLDPTRKQDPGQGLSYSRRSYEQLLRDIPLEFAECTGVAPTESLAVNTTAGTAVSVTRLNIRKGAPNTRAVIHQTVPAGTALPFVGKTNQGEPVNGNGEWFQDPNGNYFWSGGVRV